MKKLLGIVILSLLLTSNAFAGKDEFNNWLNSFGLSKPIVQDEIYYFGISYDGKPNKLINNFAILISMINEDVYSEDNKLINLNESFFLNKPININTNINIVKKISGINK